MEEIKCSISLSFESISLIPFSDILILGSMISPGKVEVAKCLQNFESNEFELILLDDDIVEVLLINKKILQRMPKDKVIEILRENVFPYMKEEEIIKVDFNLVISMENIEISNNSKDFHKLSHSIPITTKPLFLQNI